MEFGLASKNFRRGVSVSARSSRTLAFEGKKKQLGYIALVEDFTAFGLASKNFRRGVPVSARTSRILAFEGQKIGVYRSRRGFQGVRSCFQKFQKGCVRFGTNFTDIAVRRSKKNGVHRCQGTDLTDIAF